MAKVKVTEGLGIKGRARLVFHNTITDRKTIIEQRNLFVNGGRNKVRDYLAALAPGPPTHCAISNDGVAVIATTADIGTELARQSIAERIVTPQEVQINTFFSTAAAPGEDIQKAGLVDAAVAGTFFAITLFPQREKDPNETLTIEWRFEIGG